MTGTMRSMACGQQSWGKPDMTEHQFDPTAFAAALSAHEKYWRESEEVTAATVPLIRVGAMHAALTAYHTVLQAKEAGDEGPADPPASLPKLDQQEGA